MQQQRVRVEHDFVAAFRQSGCDLARCLEFTQVEETLALPDGIADELCRLSLTLSANDDTLQTWRERRS